MDCPSCGATGQTKARCEACGFTFQSSAAGPASDDALSLFLGLVCATCDAYNDPGTSVCMSCGTALSPGDEAILEPVMASPAVGPASLSSSASSAAPAAPIAALAVSSAMTAPPSWMTPPTGNALSTQLAMKKVDLASIGGEAPSPLAPPTPAPTPAPTAAPTAAPPPSLAALPTGTPRAMSSGLTPPSGLPAAPQPASSSKPPKQKCWRCTTDLEDNDKFCRNCGARTDGGVGSAPPLGGAVLGQSSAPAATQMISALKLPTAPPVGAGAAGATQILPAFKAAQSPAAPAHGAGVGPSATLFFGAATAERVAKLILVRGQSQFGNQWRLQSGETVIGRSAGMVLFPDDAALAPQHARLVFRGADLFLEPEPSTNGCFMKLREPVKLFAGDEFVIGAQRLKLLPENERPVGVAPPPHGAADHNATKLLGSMVKPLSAGLQPLALLRIAADPRYSEVYFRAQRLMTIGRVQCDVNFANDGFVSERHAQLTNEGPHVLLEDLKSRNGTYARVNGPTKLLHGDLLLVGDQVLRVELPTR